MVTKYQFFFIIEMDFSLKKKTKWVENGHSKLETTRKIKKRVKLFTSLASLGQATTDMSNVQLREY